MRPLLLASILLTTSLAAQTWAPIGAKWTYKQGIWSGPDTNLAVIENVGDTLIDGLFYSVLVPTQGYFNCFPIYEYIHYDGDSLWFWDDEAGDQHLLWCMNALPGQSWQTTLNWGGIPADTITWTVLDTASVAVDGLALRQLELGYMSSTMAMSPYCWPSCTITERLGNLKYFFDFQWGVCDAETFHGLRCYKDSTISWLNPLYLQCELMIGLNEPPSSSLLQIHPTLLAAGDALSITAGTNGTVEILDIAGRLVEIIEVGAGSTTHAMLRRGSFFLRCTDGSKRVAVTRVIVL